MAETSSRRGCRETGWPTTGLRCRLETTVGPGTAGRAPRSAACPVGCRTRPPRGRHGRPPERHSKPAGPPRCSTQVSSRWATRHSSASSRADGSSSAAAAGGAQCGQRVQSNVGKPCLRLACRTGRAVASAGPCTVRGRHRRVARRGRGRESGPGGRRRRSTAATSPAAAAPALSRPSAHSAPAVGVDPAGGLEHGAFAVAADHPECALEDRVDGNPNTCCQGAFGERTAQRPRLSRAAAPGPCRRARRIRGDPPAPVSGSGRPRRATPPRPGRRWRPRPEPSSRRALRQSSDHQSLNCDGGS